jgi:hypothetical protein
MLKPGVTTQQGSDNLNAIAAQLAKQYPATNEQMGVRLVKPGLLGDILGDAAREFLTGVLLLAFLVLAAACVNLAKSGPDTKPENNSLANFRDVTLAKRQKACRNGSLFYFLLSQFSISGWRG